MGIRFSKMHGLGNDFVIIDAINQRFKPTPEKIRALSDRRFGVGCDQVLLVETPKQPDVDFSYRMFNYDGSEVENCGNGARCFARFVREHNLTGKRHIVVETATQTMTLSVEEDDKITVNMGAPILEPQHIPFAMPAQLNTYMIPSSAGELSVGAVSMGNPHCVIQVDSVADAPVETLGAELENHSLFPNRVNVGFMKVLSRSEIDLRVFERGVGETLACGTGACAAVVSGHLQGLLDDRVTVNLPGGSLSILWPGEGQSVLKTGPASLVYHGQVKKIEPRTPSQ